MRRRQRDINIFSMSAIDLFACALGAFVLLTLVLLPYYLKVDRKYLELATELERENSILQNQQTEYLADIRACESELSASLDTLTDVRRSAEERIAQCEAVRRRDFLLITMSWGTPDDIDLHVIDPRGKRFYYSEKEHDGSRARLELDSIVGPGNEIWLQPDSVPGEYKIYFNFFSQREPGRTVEVWGKVHSQQAAFDLPVTQLTEQTGATFGRAPLIATVVVGADGGVTMR